MQNGVHKPPQIPSTSEQVAYGSTGALAGACTLPIEYAWQYVAKQQPRLSTTILQSPVVYRGLVRFWIFDVTKANLTSSGAPHSVNAGLAGASGGAAEILAEGLVRRRRPLASALAFQSSRLFICFGTYTYLSTTYSETPVPKPFWKCWLMGTAAGALGSAVVGFAEGARGRVLAGTVVPKGALAIGTVIAVQVTSCEALLNKLREQKALHPQAQTKGQM